LVSVTEGFDTSADYPDFKPATAEQVQAHELERRRGGVGGAVRGLARALGDRIDAYVEGGAASLASAAAGFYNQNRFIAKGYTGEDDIVHPEDIAPFAYTDPALDKRAAHANSARARRL